MGAAKDAIELAIDEGELEPDDRAGALRVAGAALGYHLDTIHDHSTEEGGHERVDKVLEAIKAAGEPVNAGKVVEMTGLDCKVVDKAMNELKKTERIESPERCIWQPKG